MSNEPKTLKQQNSLQIGAYVVINVLVFWGLANGIGINFQSSNSLPEQLFTSALWSIIIGTLTTILSGQMNQDFKYFLIFWRLKDRLPACRAFSYFMNQDPRIDPKAIEAKLTTIPTDPTEQNRTWYKIYKRHQDKNSVIDAHKNFLLTREVTGLSFLFLITLGSASFFFFPSWKLSIFYLIGLLVLFLLASQAGRNYGARFVTNVLAEECTDTSTSTAKP
ncbi:MAG: hypothetical protein HC840_06020 [Leptolyngbyaceae cyanobacterium RM2_2_4]|nr:hypothetical protein [Leptolyngbyaceae cyanobacterium SM1_4_3]NJO49091.1 hypothetical protein [Leptolyngbyaceae cyanobacterium RM2_2_4]